MKQNGRALEYASKELKNDKEVVLEAMKQNWCALKYASEELRNPQEEEVEEDKALEEEEGERAYEEEGVSFQRKRARR